MVCCDFPLVNVLKFQRRWVFIPLLDLFPFQLFILSFVIYARTDLCCRCRGFHYYLFPGLIRNFAAFGICIFMATLSGAWAAIISPSRVL